MTAVDFEAFVDRLTTVAGEAILPFFRTTIGVEDKGRPGAFDPVTAADRAGERAMRGLIEATFPSHGILGEEYGQVREDAELVWVLDPIDGTNNFALGIEHCAIGLALCEHGNPIYGVVYDLSRRMLMHGGPGFGMFDGERPRSISLAEPTRETLIGFHSPFDKALVPMACGILANFKIRGLGSATLHLAYVAAGLLDGCVDYNVKIWDLAAAIPLVLAAGGEVKFLNGEQLPMRVFNLRMQRIIYVAGSPATCARLEKLIMTENVASQINSEARKP